MEVAGISLRVGAFTLVQIKFMYYMKIKPNLMKYTKKMICLYHMNVDNNTVSNGFGLLNVWSSSMNMVILVMSVFIL